MGKIILVTGGSRSGKSRFAEELFKDKDDVLYIATGIVTDNEMEERIHQHRERRNAKWTTYEGYKNLDTVIEKYDQKYIMLDCVTVMVTNLMFEENIDFDAIKREQLESLQKNMISQFESLIKKARETGKVLVMVTDEVGCGIVPEYKISRIFRDIAGSINQEIAALCDEVYLVSCGLPLRLK